MKHHKMDNLERILAFVNDYYRDNHRSPSLRVISAGTGVSRMTVQRMLNTMAEEGLIDYDGYTVVTEITRKTDEETVRVGILGSIACGELTLENDAVEEVVALPVSLFGKGDLFLLYARGDSMTGAGIDEGDLVLFRKQEEANPGDIVAAYVAGEGNTLKRLMKDGSRFYLHPENPKYRDIPITEGKIQGVAMKVIKNL